MLSFWVNSKNPMPTAFPICYIDKTDPRFQRLSRYVFVLQPPVQGATAHEFVQLEQDLKSGIEAKTLSESIPHTSFDGKKFTLQSLKDEVKQIISDSSPEWIRECDGIFIMHHPEKQAQLDLILSQLPESAQAPNNQKLLSITYEDDLFVFVVRLHENKFVPPDSLVLGLNNPSEPVAEHLIQNDGGGLLTLTDLYASKQKMENFAMNSFCKDLISNSSITPDDLKSSYEPLGNTFPDFELFIRKQAWAIEVTRIESGMVSYVQMTEPMEKDRFEKAAQNCVTEVGIVDALNKALDKKTRRRAQCSKYFRFCLLLVDVVDSISGKESPVWNGIDLSAFDVIALVKFDGSVTYIKGTHVFNSI